MSIVDCTSIPHHVSLLSSLGSMSRRDESDASTIRPDHKLNPISTPASMSLNHLLILTLEFDSLPLLLLIHIPFTFASASKQPILW